ncbi:MAG: alpha/beta fold hydrolase [Patescibacteria group bacterium]|jgi:pimeloyl-ACP methyl ester carboxylesterase
MRERPEIAQMNMEENEKTDMEYGELTIEEKEKLAELEQQFHNPQSIEIPMPESEDKTMRVEYVILDCRHLDKSAQSSDNSVVIIPGFGASYRSPEHLAKMLALKENKRVFIMSQPSTGQSDMPPKEWRQAEDFHLFAETLNNTLDAVRKNEAGQENQLTTEQVDVVGPSMGALIGAEYASRHQDKVSNLVLLHPSGIEKGLGKLAAGYLQESPSSKMETKKMDKVTPREINEQRQAYNELWGDTAKLRLIRNLAGNKYDVLINNTPGDSLQEKLSYLWDAELDAQLQGLGPDVMQQIYSMDKNTLAEEYPDMPEEIDLNKIHHQYVGTHKQVQGEFGPDSASNFKKAILWRLWEARTIAKGKLPELLKKVEAKISIVMSSRDKMFPATQIGTLEQKTGKKFDSTVLTTKHDDLQRDARLYAAQIGGHLGKSR